MTPVPPVALIVPAVKAAEAAGRVSVPLSVIAPVTLVPNKVALAPALMLSVPMVPRFVRTVPGCNVMAEFATLPE